MRSQALPAGSIAESLAQDRGSLRAHLGDRLLVAVLVGAVLVIGLVDLNDQLLSTNDIYIFKQIHTYNAAYSIRIIGDRSLRPTVGVIDGRALDQDFRASFPGLWDLIPPREPLYFLNQFKRATAH